MISAQQRAALQREILQTASLQREFASDRHTELNATHSRINPLNPQYLAEKQSAFQKISAFVETCKHVGGDI